MLSPFRTATLLLTVVVVCVTLSLAADRPKPPTFLRAPVFLSESEPLSVEVQIEPHIDIRSVILELWEIAGERASYADDQPDTPPILYELGPLVRSSVEPVDERNADQRTFRFEWESQAAGIYALVARIGVTRGLTYSTPLRKLEVR